MENKGFLTLEEARDQAEAYLKYQEGVYKYEIKGEGWTLIEHGNVVLEGAHYVHWIEKGVYGYGIDCMDCGEVLIKRADLAHWIKKGVYDYKMKGGKWIEVNNNK